MNIKNGCAIKCEYFQTIEIDRLGNKDDWSKLISIGMVKKKIESIKEIKIECKYYISSLNIDINLFSKSIREHLGIENKLHWHLDFTFNNTLNKDSLASLEIVNKFCLEILKRVQEYYGINLKRIIGKLSMNVKENFLELIALLALADGIDKKEI